MEAGTQEGQWQASLADFWMFEHLLSLPSSIISTEIVNHFGGQFPHRESENASMPASLSARMFLRHMSTDGPASMWELLQVLGLLQKLSRKQHQFHSRAAARSIVPPAELVTEVLLQCLCTQADPSRVQQGSQQEQVLTAADVNTRAQELLEEAELEHPLDDEMLLNRLSLLEQLLRGCRDAAQLQRQLQVNFPADAVEEQLRDFQYTAMRGLGLTSLQMYQEAVLSGGLPAHPFQHFAALMPISTQQAYEAEPEAAAAAEEQAEQGHGHGQQQQQQRGTGPVSLLPEATAPVLGMQELDAGPGSSDAKRAGRGGRQQQAAAAAASPKARASPKAGAAAAAAAAAADGGDTEHVGRRARAAAGQKAVKDSSKQDAPAGGRPSRKQLHLEPTSATAAPAPAPAAAAAAAAAGGGQEEAPDAAAAAGGSKKGRRSRKQQQPPEAGPDSELIGTEYVAPAAAAGGASGGRKRRLAAAAAAAGAAAEQEEEEQEPGEAQLQDGSQPNATDGVEPAAGSGAAAGKGRGIASAFMEVLAAVRRSPSGTAGRKSQKLCGAPEQGVRGKTVEWNSPLGGSTDGPEDSPRHAAKQSAAAAAGGRPAGSALKHKRGHDEGHRGPVAAARAAGGRGGDSGNTEYEDAQEEAGSESEGARGGRGQRGRKPQGGRKPRREEGDDVDDDSYIEDPESEESESLGAGAYDFDDTDDDLGGEQGQGRQQQAKQRSGGAAAAAAGRGGGDRAAGSKGAGAAAAWGAARGAGGPRSRPVGVELFDDSDDAAELPAGFKRRRQVRRWSKEEELLLTRLVAECGEGQWALILTQAGDGFDRRTQVDLKDKWRNLSKKVHRPS